MAQTAPESNPRAVTVVSASVIALAIRLAVTALTLDRVLAGTRWIVRSARQPATHDEVTRVLDAVDKAARWVPVRLACLERSLTAVVLLAARRRGVTWRMGIRTPPFAAHAWVADDSGMPVGEPSSTSAYQPLITISWTDRTNRSVK